MADDEEAIVRKINVYRGLMTGLITEHLGRVVDAKGDNVVAEFPSVVDAVRCAVQIQKDLTEKLRVSGTPQDGVPHRDQSWGCDRGRRNHLRRWCQRGRPIVRIGRE